MLQNAYFLAKIGADTAENEQHFAEILPIGRRVADRGTLRYPDFPARARGRVVHRWRIFGVPLHGSFGPGNPTDRRNNSIPNNFLATPYTSFQKDFSDHTHYLALRTN